MLVSRCLGLVVLAIFGSLEVSSSFSSQSLPTTNTSTNGKPNNSNNNNNISSSLQSSSNNDDGDSNDSNDGTATTTTTTTKPTLYEEMRDMAALSFLVYSFAYTTDMARTEGLKGLDVSDKGRVSAPSRDLPRSFTPQEILDIVLENRDALREKYDFAFGDNAEYELLLKNLKVMQERIDQYTKENNKDDGGETNKENLRPLTLEEFDDQHQSHEMVYAVTKDDINKRITLVFRGTENELAMTSNWSTNLYMTKSKAEIPDVLQNKNDEVIIKNLNIHSGFLNYVFSPTKDPMDDSTFRKYDEILHDTKELLAAHPGYQLYVTGHSLGGALSTLVAFYLACDPDIPKPVTCISFASPRLGDKNFLKATIWLEKQGMLRMLRVVNDKDSVAHFPVLNYKHVGFQARMYREEGKLPAISYPKKSDGWNFERMLENSFLRSFNLAYDHGDYRERVEKDKEYLAALDWEKLYNNSNYTGTGEL